MPYAPLPVRYRNMPDPPHPLDLYRLSVQHPLAEVAFIERVWDHYHPGQAGPGEPLLLREDFAGSCATAVAWVQSDPERQAMAVELDTPTAEWAANRWAGCPRCGADLHIVVEDVMAVPEPETDVTLALNFSALIYHDEASLLNYLRHARQCLTDDGLLILDLFGIDPAKKTGEQSQTINPDDPGISPFTYTWEQRAFDPATRRIDCRIHFMLADGTELRDAFVYDWRLWEMGTVLRLMRDAGFAHTEAWGPSEPNSGGPTDGRFAPLSSPPPAGEWVCYLVGVC